MAQTYKFGNGTWARKKGSTLAYSDTNNAFKPLPFSFERNSIATRVNKEGLIEVVGNDIPRIDYTDSTEGALLLEPSRSNLIPYSEDFSQGWSKIRTTVLINNSTSPNGSLSTYKIVPSVDNNTHRIDYVLALTENNIYTYSIFAKKGEYNCLALQIGSTTINANSAEFNLNTGTSVSGGGAIISSKIEPFANDWFKCSLTMLAGADNRINLGIGNDNIYVFAGDGTSGVYLWGAQLEQGNVASSYIPTNGSTVQRAAETCNNSGNSEVFNDSQGVLFADISALANDGTNRVLSLSNGGYSNSIRIQYYSVSNQLEFRVVSSGSAVVLQRVTISDTTLFNKILVKYKLNDFALWANGFEILTDINGATPIGLNEIRFDDGDGNVPFYGKTKEIAYYDTILTDEELEYMTSYRSLNEMVTELNLNAL